MKKTAFFLAFLALTAFAANAQRFDWATGFGSSDEGCLIKGTVTDDEGNLYILGQFTYNATWEGHRLLPIAPYGPHNDTYNTLIAKVSPDGQMLWKKVIHSNNGQSNMPEDIKKVGDTSFACLIYMTLPSSDSYTYYLDTLLPTWSDYPVEAWGMGYKICTAYLLFDFEGNVLEQHFLQLTYTDTVGNDIVHYYDGEPWYTNDCLHCPSFDVDAGGNIYISRIASDYINENCTSQNGAISSVKFWVDRRLAGTCAVENRPMQWFPQLLKFSPHFDTLLVSRYVVQKCDSVNYNTSYTRTKLDADGNVYFTLYHYMVGQHANTIVIDSSRGLQFHHHDKERIKDFLVRLDSSLTPQWLITLEDSVTNPSLVNSALIFHDIGIDNDSNLVFITTTTGRGRVHDTTTFNSILTYHGTPLSLKNVSFFMSFKTDQDNPQMYSYGGVHSVFGGQIPVSSMGGNIACKNNRLFMQSQYMGGVIYPSRSIVFDDSYADGIGLSIFDYRGNPIMGVDYAALSPDNRPGSMCLKDSILYVSGRLTSDATFGDIYLPNQEDFAFIARYVDTAFMTPYVYTGDTSDVRITVVDDEGAFVVYPNPFRQRVTIKVEGGEPLAETAWLTDFTGRQEQVRLTAEGTGRYSLDLTARPQASYLLTLTTVSGKTHTLRLLKQSDVFAQ